MFAQEQDSNSGGLDAGQTFSGQFHDIAISINGEPKAHCDMQVDEYGHIIDTQYGLDLTLTGDTSVLRTNQTDEDTAITFDVLANDTDAEGDTLTITAVDNPVVIDGVTVGTAEIITVDGAQQIQFTPDESLNSMAEGETQNISFNYTISDGQGGSDSTTVSLAVSGTNDAPAITVVDTTVTEDTAQIIASARDIDGTINSTNLTADHGTVTIDDDGNITYSPDANYNGADSVQLSITDDGGATTTQTINLTIDNTQDSPVAVDDMGFAPQTATLVTELNFDAGAPAATVGLIQTEGAGQVGQSADFSSAKLTVNGLDLDGSDGAQTTVTMWVQANSEGSWEMLAASGNYDLVMLNGNVGFNTAAGDLFGTDASELNDGEWHQIVATFTNGDVSQNTIHIDGVEQPMSQIQNTPNNSNANIDSDNGTLNFGSWGRDNNYRFTGSMDEIKVFNGTLSDDEISELYDLESGHNHWENEALITDEDTTLTISPSELLANDSDADGDSLSITSVQDAEHGTVEINGDGDIVFTPDADYSGEASFTYTISDGNGGEDTATANLNMALFALIVGTQ